MLLFVEYDAVHFSGTIHVLLRLMRERRSWEVRLLSEKNRLEKLFAEEKLKLVRRLQVGVNHSCFTEAKVIFSFAFRMILTLNCSEFLPL